MKPVTAAFTFGILTTSLIAQQPPTTRLLPDFNAFTQPELFVNVEPGLVRFTVLSEYSPYIGIVLISASSALVHEVTALPALLDQSMILTYGFSAEPRFSTAVEESVFPPGVMWHVQGVVWSDTAGILASDPESFVLDASGPSEPQDAPDATTADPKAEAQRSDATPTTITRSAQDVITDRKAEAQRTDATPTTITRSAQDVITDRKAEALRNDAVRTGG